MSGTSGTSGTLSQALDCYGPSSKKARALFRDRLHRKGSFAAAAGASSSASSRTEVVGQVLVGEAPTARAHIQVSAIT